MWKVCLLLSFLRLQDVQSQSGISFEVTAPDGSVGDGQSSTVQYETFDDDRQMLIDIEQNITNVERKLSHRAESEPSHPGSMLCSRKSPQICDVVEVTSTTVTISCSCYEKEVVYLSFRSKQLRNCNCQLKHRYWVKLNNSQCEKTFYNLCPYTIYDFFIVRDFFVDEESCKIQVKTLPAEPKKISTEMAKALSSSTIYLKWKQDCPNAEVTYNVTWSPGQGELETNKMELTVDELSLYTVYTFVIQACDVHNQSLCSEKHTVEVRTLPGEPSQPREFRAVGVSSSEIHLSWNHPEYPRGPIGSYLINCSREDGRNRSFHFQVVNRTLQHQVNGLEPWTNYRCVIRAFNDDPKRIFGKTSVVNATTKPGYPGKPIDLKIVAKTSDELFLTWRRIPSYPKGPIDGYVITASSIKENELTNVTSDPHFRLEGLKPGTNYNITVYAYNFDGSDRLNGSVAWILGKTIPIAPSAPRKFCVIKTISGEIFLKWQRPLFPNGPINGYVIKVLDDESVITVSGAVDKYQLKYLTPDTNYTFTLLAFNVDKYKKMEGETTTATYRTKTEEPSMSEVVDTLRRDLVGELSRMHDLMDITFHKLEANGNGRKEIGNDPETIPNGSTKYQKIN